MKRIILTLLLAGCGTDLPGKMQLPDRENRPTYLCGTAWDVVCTPNHDTTKPVVTLFLADLTAQFHTFTDMEIPPSAQVARWQAQVQGRSKPISGAGFYGLAYEAPGVRAFALSLDPNIKSHLLSLAETQAEYRAYLSMAADWTLKVTGPEESLKRHHKEIESLVQSLELIEELPCP